jgi:hypothetical protein
MKMKIQHTNTAERRSGSWKERAASRKESRRSTWTDFYTYRAVPALFAAQECFKQEQR